MAKENLKIVIVGHVDHGKSTLIGRLLLDTHSLPEEKLREIKKISAELGKESGLAFLTDHLKEEREQDMTIDTTQIFFKSRERNYVIIDSPGHVEFLKNMLTGATLAEAAVLIVDTAAGIEEQTRRHVYLLGMLGIKNIIVLFNKMDLTGFKEERFQEVKEDLLRFLASLKLKPLFLIPASAREGENIYKKSVLMSWYKGPCLLEALDSLEPEEKREKRLPLRFAIQDIYEIDGERIAVGKVLSGTLKRGEAVKLFPSLKDAAIKQIKIFPKKVRAAAAGQNIGVILDDPSLAKRGEVISDTNSPCSMFERFRADIFWMSEVPLEINKPFTFRCATQEVTCIVEKIEKRIDSSTLEILEEDAGQLQLNEAGLVVFKTESPVVLEKFAFLADVGRFVLEKNFNLCGAGIITQEAA